ncbi:6-bladed beta-propeller [Ancylomarina sp. DW003]|nr:DUF4933 domain-containing protein [Ancylomarina sp. DW003]MDE5423178.1 6-bladed beta-propeller [Ancylomarina sp. DW003]
MRNYLVMVLLFSLLGSCQSNKMKTDEKKLVNKILSEEKKLVLEEENRLEKERILADSIAKLPKGFRFKENRSIDRNYPPLVIDIANNLDSIKEIKLSNVASDIEYIKMQPIPDPSIPKDLKLKYYFMDNYIVASNLYGIHLYSKKGIYIRAIVKNQLRGLKIDQGKNRITIRCAEYSHVGGSNSVWARGNNLFYNYRNSLTGQNMIMELDCSQQHVASYSGFDPENPNAITGLGNVCIDINHGKNKPEKPIYPNGMISTSIDHFDKEFNVFNPDRNTYITQLENDKMLGVVSTKGDTLASFRKLEQVKNYTKRLMRGIDAGTQYESGGNFFFRTDFNDTIFQVIPPNNIRPVYVLNLGKYKINKQEGVDPDVSLKGKLMPLSFADAKDYIFLSFAADNHVCPKNIRNKSLKLYYAVYSKKNHKLHFVRSNPIDYNAEILVNDLDGGVSVWAESHMINRKGEIMLALKGKDLKDHVKSTLYKSSSASLKKKEHLKLFANSLSAKDDILMLVK